MSKGIHVQRESTSKENPHPKGICVLRKSLSLLQTFISLLLDPRAIPALAAAPWCSCFVHYPKHPFQGFTFPPLSAKSRFFPQIWKRFLAFFEKHSNWNFVIFVQQELHGEKRFLSVHWQTVHLFVCFFHVIQAWNKDKGFPNYCQIDLQRVWSQHFI